MNASSLIRRLGAGLALSVALASSALVASPQAALADGGRNAVYVASNDPNANTILIYNRAADGTLLPSGSVATGGRGIGGFYLGIGSQYSVILSDDGRWLFAVNAGSNEISSFAVTGTGLTLASKVASGGLLPVSMTLHDDVLYVLNGGGSGNISGFNVGEHGELIPLAGSTRNLSNNGVGTSPLPNTIQFDPSGEWLIVSELASNKLSVYPVNASGIAGTAMAYPAAGVNPFGFAFDKRGHVIVSEAFGNGVNAGAVSSYDFSDDGHLTVISPSVPTHQTAACWVVVTKNGKYAYSTNATSSVVTGFRVARNGSLTELNGNGVTGVPGAAPLDEGLSKDSRYLYTLNVFSSSISVFRIEDNGSLTSVQELKGLPSTIVEGLAAR